MRGNALVPNQLFITDWAHFIFNMNYCFQPALPGFSFEKKFNKMLKLYYEFDKKINRRGIFENADYY